ncbi:hypothetical protein D8674_038199 [Pyrus ussuriensis x Pyrus communis]|uniref:AB hydrolase-1 domain-containing protein n=1 Tax=Pyrus ussuriensis x Pyrus communis TaxID=2448454 RepID=A0A5N5I4M4_9ROSA|nr:hypothetical protein D8674_038199 [Pyrus ussuriensis x Pyrus communis]
MTLKVCLFIQVFSISNINTYEIELAPTNPSKQHFVLVHGSCFGAWSWYKLVTLIRSSGHNVTALDLAASGVDPRQAKDLRSISDYLKPLKDFMEAVDGKVILVGHSLDPIINLLYYNLLQDVALGSMLMRPVRLFSEEDLSKELKLTNEKYGSVNRVYVISDGDLVGKKDFQRWMIKKNQPNSVVEIAGSDHMVMISKPLELWLHLQRIIKKYT